MILISVYAHEFVTSFFNIAKMFTVKLLTSGHMQNVVITGIGANFS